MKNQTWLLLLFAALILPFFAFAQVKKCHTYESLQEFKKQNPGAQTDAQFESWLSKKIKEAPLNQRMLSSYIIPVIFHIVHNGEAVGSGSNISAAKIQQQLDQLNKDFSNNSESKYEVAADAKIRFELAVMDPLGRKLAEPGIERINRNTRGWSAPPYTISTYNSFADQTIMPSTIWSPYQYFNVWVMHIESPILGKATFPSASTLVDLGAGSGDTDTHSGVMIHYGSVGSVANPGPYGTVAGLGRTLTHEAGHFFGLRHIWGDAACGNDYCSDTPEQDQQTEECPTGLMAGNCTPAVSKMYENYMDYTFDACVNTFTADQVARMQTVMLNSPRRRQLAQSIVHIALPDNSIRFENVSFSFSENGINTTACPGYREVEVNLNVFEAADNMATVQFMASGTARAGVDYELVTPTLTFQAGENTKTLVLRIFDDAVVEETEQIVLQYAVTGSGVQPASENQMLTIDIIDNDVERSISQNGPSTLLFENFGVSGGGLMNNWQQILWGQQEGKNIWTISNNGGAGFDGRVALISNDGVTNTYTHDSEADVILLSKQINTKGFSNISISFKYKCEGEAFSDDEVYDFGTLVYSLDGKSFHILPDIENDNKPFLFHSKSSVTQFNRNFGNFFDGKNFYLGFRWVNDDSYGSELSFTIDDVTVTGNALKVGDAPGETAKQYVWDGQKVFLTNSQGSHLIAKIENAAANLGCVTASVTAAGSGNASITTPTGTYLRTQKVVQITPAQQATATITLYYTAAELAPWGSAKGFLKVLKVKDGVSLEGVLTTANAELITPDAVTEYAADGYTAYTFTVSSFSQFMLVSPAFTLPVKLVQFEAQPDGRQIKLQWRTEDEKENKGFWVERSADGVRFEPAGWVSSSGAGKYEFNDRLVQPGVLYYYRLQQVDFNGKSVYSAIRQVRLNGGGLQVQVSPNPATDKVHVFVSGSSQRVTIRLVNSGGGVAGQWHQVDAFNTPFVIPLGHLPKGLYTVLVLTAEGMHSQKIIKQ